MKCLKFGLVMLLFGLSGCARERTIMADRSAVSAPVASAIPPQQMLGGAQQGQQGQRGQQSLALAKAASAVEAEPQASLDRKIIRQAELVVELDSPTEAQRRLAALAEGQGGYVVTTESQSGGPPEAAGTTVNIVIRVPASKFNLVIEGIQSLGGSIKQQKITGQDVTEEYIDLDARMRTQKALEAQFLEIMKTARKVSEALEVQTQIAAVRTEIERMEGRRRFLDSQTAFSTITVTLRPPMPIVTATGRGFFYDVKLAFGESIDLIASILLGLLRAIIILGPVILLLGVPFWYLIRFGWRRWGGRWTAPGNSASVIDPQ
jgi:hypothetical protein